MHQSGHESRDIQAEITAYKHALKLYGIELSELIKLTPDCIELRQKAKKIAHRLALRQVIKELLGYPSSEAVYAYIARYCPKTLDPKYLLALAILFGGDYQSIKAYVF